jgi:hypothetical protein
MKIIELIFREHPCGTEEEPHLVCPQLWTKDGKLVAQYNPHKDTSFFRPDVLADLLAH